MTLNGILEGYKKQGFHVDVRRKTKLAKWALLSRKRDGLLSFGSEDMVYVYLVEGNVKIDHINDFLKRYKKIYNENNLDKKDVSVFYYTGKLNTKEFRKLSRQILDSDQYSIMKIKKIDIKKENKEKDKSSRGKNQSDKIFIVHGHDEEMKHSVARTITQLGLKPIILHELSDKGRTLIEKFEQEAFDIRFTVILLSPDDIGGKKDNNLKYRARQNVIFELGFFISKLGRNRVFILVKNINDFERPSDIRGVIYTEYDSGGAWRYRLCHELKECKYKVSADNLR